nr:hypothetical protein [Siccirubricoccus sp. G192]
MGIYLGLRHGERSFALARSDEQEAHLRPDGVNQGCGLQQDWDALLPRQARHRHDDLRSPEAELLAKLGGRRTGCQGPGERLDVDSRAGDQPAEAITHHPAPLEKGLVFAVLEDRGYSPARGDPVERVIDGAQCQGERGIRRMQPAHPVDRADHPHVASAASRQRNEEIRFRVEALDQVGPHLIEEACERGYRAPIRQRAGGPVEVKGVIGETCPRKGCRVAGPGCGYTEALAAQRQEELDPEIVVLASHEKQVRAHEITGITMRDRGDDGSRSRPRQCRHPSSGPISQSTICRSPFTTALRS